jgi:cytochrome d ubiquinol oxidase subunit II
MSALAGIGLPEVIALLMLAGLVAYTLLGGADFGGGLWDLFATGPRARAQRALIEDVMAPVWETNHIWLIFVVVLLFSAFPPAFAVVTTALHVPLTLMLVGIVARGAAFVFRQYDDRRDEVQRRWGRVFAVASIVTPLFLGACLGAVTAGTIRVEDHVVTTGFFASWLTPFSAACGVLVLALFAFLAAVYLTCEAGDPSLRDDFRVRAIVAGVALGAAALVAALSAGAHTAGFGARLFGSWWSLPHQVVTGAVAVTALAALVTRRFRVARAAAIAQAVLMIVGWGLAQAPYLVTPDVTIAGAAAPRATLVVVAAAVGGGSVLLVPALYALMRVFRMGAGRRLPLPPPPPADSP